MLHTGPANSRNCFTIQREMTPIKFSVSQINDHLQASDGASVPWGSCYYGKSVVKTSKTEVFIFNKHNG